MAANLTVAWKSASVSARTAYELTRSEMFHSLKSPVWRYLEQRRGPPIIVKKQKREPPGVGFRIVGARMLHSGAW